MSAASSLSNGHEEHASKQFRLAPAGLESFAIEKRNVVRSVRLRNGNVVRTTMGPAGRRSRRTAETADAAWLRSDSPPPTASPTRSDVRVVDAFSGCGGLSLGLREAARAVARPFVPVAAIDTDETALSTYARNFEVQHAISESMARLVSGNADSRLTSNERGLERRFGRIDFLLAGPPCQGFTSLNNHTRGDDTRNRLYPRVARLARVIEPRYVLVENVPTVRSGTSAAVANTVSALEAAGYVVTEGIVDLEALGVPQQRRRHVLIAAHRSAPTVDDIVAAFRYAKRDLKWAIGDLATRAGEGAAFDRPSTASPENEKRLAWLRRHRSFDLPNHERPSCHHGDHSYVSMYGRLRWQRPAQTITSGYGSMGQGRYVHPNGRRTLTPHEAARVQLFPDWFDFGSEPRGAWANMIGNAVPMKLSYAVGLWFLR